jgi:hypothetical protein
MTALRSETRLQARVAETRLLEKHRVPATMTQRQQGVGRTSG